MVEVQHETFPAYSFSKDIEDNLRQRHIEAIVIGASAGGITALLTLLAKLPEDFHLPVIIVLHMPDMHDSRLTDVFQFHMSAQTMMAEDKDWIKPGRVYFANPGYHLSIERNKSFSLSCEEPVYFSRPSIDILMSSAADAYGKALAGILLTGASQDGANGMARIHLAGGITVVQDPFEAEMAVMPQAAINLFTPDFIFPLRDIRRLIFSLEKS